MAGPSSTSNYAIAGAAVGKEAENLFKVTRQNSPDMSALVQNAAKRAAEKDIAAMKIKSEILQRGVTEVTKTENYKQGVEAEANAKSAGRKAGLLATAGGYLGKGIGGLGDSDYTKRDVGASDALYDGRIQSSKDRLA